MIAQDVIVQDEVEPRPHPFLAGLLKFLLLLVMQCLTVVLVGFVALFVSFEPVWSEETPQVFARPSARLRAPVHRSRAPAAAL